MKVDEIIELIRREEVVLWIGSGFSLYAGYPTGAVLAQTIYDSLSPSEKKNIVAGLPLADAAEQHVRIKGNNRADLCNLVHKVFVRKPSSLHVHQSLARIPHIRTIITTNYDRLFEKAYGDRITPIIKESDVANAEKTVELFKVHGDIEYPDTMVITRSDYTEFYYRRMEDNLLWANIKARISQKAVVFIGYDLEDENIKIVLKRVTESMGCNRKKMFLIAPGFKKHKVDSLKQLKIEYLDSKGETFVDNLSRSLNEHIMTDFDRGHVAPDTFRLYLRDRQLSPVLSAGENHFRLESIKTLSNQLPGQISFNPSGNDDLVKKLLDISTGKQIGEVMLDSQILLDLKVLLNDVNIFSEDTPFQIVLQSRPSKKGTISVTFEDGTEFDEIDYKVYVTKALLQVTATYKGSNFIFQMSNPSGISSPTVQTHLSFEPAVPFKTVNEAISTYQLGLKLAESKGINIFSNGKPHPYHLTLSEPEMPLPALQTNLKFFEALKKIQTAYNIRFTELGDYTKEDYNNAIIAAMFANGQTHTEEYNETLKCTVSPDAKEDELKKIEGNSLTAFAQVEEKVTIYEQEINLGYKIIELHNLQASNLKAVLNGNTKTVRIRPKDRKLLMYYSPKLPDIDPANGVEATPG